MRKLGQRKAASKPIDVFIATPAYDGKVQADYSQSLAETSFCFPLYGLKMTASVMGNGAFIELARNIFVDIFLNDFPECTHLFFIDADLKFEARAVIGLAKAGKPICAGVYRRRQEPEDFPCRFVQHKDGGGLWVENEWIMHDRVPTGFLCIERKIIEEMAAAAPKMTIYGQKRLIPQVFMTRLTGEENRFMGEDYSFCDDYVARYGEFIHVWPDMDFVHAGYKCNYHNYLAREVKKEEDRASEEKKAEEATSSAA